MMSLRALWFAVPLALFVGCGGKSEDDGNDGGTGGSSGGDAGSSGSKGGSGGSGAVGSSGGTAGVAGGCCLAYPVCPDGATEVPSNEPCPAGSSCEDVSICCSTIRCASPAAQCNAFPACDPGDPEISGRSVCPPGTVCYTRTLCGNTIFCEDIFCDPENEPNLHYVAMGDSCGLIDYTCPAQTTYFGNSCGCGCAQDASCPPAIDCEPGPDPNPNCSDEILAKCPYSPRGL